MVTETASENSSPIRPASPIESHCPIHHVRHVTTLAEELHDFLPGSCQLRFHQPHSALTAAYSFRWLVKLVVAAVAVTLILR